MTLVLDERQPHRRLFIGGEQLPSGSFGGGESRQALGELPRVSSGRCQVILNV